MSHVRGVVVGDLPDRWSDHLGESRADRIAMALMPSVAPLRTITLPRMSLADATATVTRSITRYFPAARGPQVVALARVGDQYVVSAVPAALLQELEARAREQGVIIDRIVPAYAAWSLATQRPVITVTHEDGLIEQFRVTRDTPFDVRRWREGGEESEGVEANAYRIADPQAAAARYAPAARVLEFLTPDLAARRLVVRRRKTMGALAAVVVLAVCTMAGVWWHTRQTLQQLTTEREALQSKVAVALRAQSVFARVQGPAQTLASIEEHGVQWTPVIAELADRLPEDAYVSSFTTEADSVMFAGAGVDGARAVRAVETSALLTDVKMVGDIQRNLPADTAHSPILESFFVVFHVPHAAPLVPPSKHGQTTPVSTATATNASDPAKGGLE